MATENTAAAKISVGRDVNGQVVIGDGNLIHTSPGKTGPSPTLHQQNTAKDHGTAYSAAQGDIHIHHHDVVGETDASDESDAC
ncbi:hypothetical protein ABH935_006746 [Catenulispora sp. GAS73]|uniref:hypothetical protein n=1 Tax=Catenulispora sp. GAS73 TaxID=3156269 RepID=UPI00351449CB